VRRDRTAAWAALAGRYQAHGRDLDLREAFARDPQRFAALSFEAPETCADLSKNLVDTATMRFSPTWPAKRPRGAVRRVARRRAGQHRRAPRRAAHRVACAARRGAVQRRGGRRPRADARLAKEVRRRAAAARRADGEALVGSTTGLVQRLIR
jgi:hypothetical protein